MKRSLAAGLSLLVLLGLAPLGSRALDRPLTKDDVALLLIGGASAQKMIAVIEQRGIDFRMNPDLAKKFHDDGASDDVIDALQKAGEKRTASAPATAGAPSENPSPPAPVAAEAPPASGHAPGSAPSPAAPRSSAEQKIAATLAETASVP